MRKNLFIAAVIAPCIFLMLFSEGISKNNGDVLTVEAEGSGVIENDDTGNARNNAIRDALRKAVEHVVLILIPQKTAAEKSQALEDGIYAKYENYIYDYRIVGERHTPSHYTVGIKSKLSVRDIKDNLRNLGLLADVREKGPYTSAVITVRGLESYADYAKMKELLMTRRSVMHCQPQRMEHNMATLVLTVQGDNIRSLTDELMLTGQFSLPVVREDQQSLTVTYQKQR